MKKIIEGKRYDTQTAIHVANHWNGRARSDHRFDETDLYRTRSGNWFLAGFGGGMSRWSGSSGTFESGLKPIDADEARKFLDEAGLTDLAEQHFGDAIVDA
jgi:hypothetical protein